MIRKTYSRERKLNNSRITQRQEEFIEMSSEDGEKVVVERVISSWLNGRVIIEEY